VKAREIRALGNWGSQGGLLSEAELAFLMEITGLIARERGEGFRMLEVGHYYGLSTMGIVRTLQQSLLVHWKLITLDAHCADPWVPATDPNVFFKNQWDRFPDPRVEVQIQRSELLTGLPPLDAVFYDGDHGNEQFRFTQMVHATPGIKTFLFDDRDFPVPVKCVEFLRDHGWDDFSPQLVRGPQDKAHPLTMSIGWFRRG